MKRGVKNLAPNYLPLHVPSGSKPVRFARVGGSQPQVDVRSVVEAMRMGWARWESCVVLLCAQQRWPLFPAVDAVGRRTRLLWAADVPRLLPLLGAAALVLQPAAGRRLGELAKSWRANWVKVCPEVVFTGSVNAERAAGHSRAALEGGAASYALAVKSPAVTITRDVERQVKGLAAQGRSLAEIGRQLDISKASASLLARGKYIFAPSEASHLPLKKDTLRGNAKLTVESFDQIHKLLALHVPQSAIARELRLSKSAVSRAALGQTSRESLPSDWRLCLEVAAALKPSESVCA